MEEYLKIKINLKISGPINFNKTFLADYKNMSEVLYANDNSLCCFIDNLKFIVENLGRCLTSFEYYGFDIDYKQNK